MFRKSKKNKLPWNLRSVAPKDIYQALGIPKFNITWYPNGRSCADKANRTRNSQHMPPLMVRKPEWRR